MSVTRTDLVDTRVERDTLRESLDQWKERHATVEQNMLPAEASAEKANQERDALMAEQDRLGEIQVGLTALLSAIDTKP